MHVASEGHGVQLEGAYMKSAGCKCRVHVKSAGCGCRVRMKIKKYVCVCVCLCEVQGAGCLKSGRS